ncbi:MAG: hypothetical protein N3A62_04440 [Thermodesulfovibrionales bacterium]|nr:hypothetical protein [Thermodesulfovibrionales bacterium]
MKENKEDILKKFREFISSLKVAINQNKTGNIEDVKTTLSRINEYFFNTHDEIGYTNILEDTFQYFSEFHKFWEIYHMEILNPKIDDTKAMKIAEVLRDIYVKYGKEVFWELYDTSGLEKKDICKIRYLTANQDFRALRDFKYFAQLYIDDPTLFDLNNVYKHPDDFLSAIGITNLSQGDKRSKYASKAAELMINNNIEPYDLLSFCKNDLLKVKELILDNKGSGYGNKKTDMFIRDMVVLGVWENAKNFDKIDVASDINTIKVALRTGLLKTDILLVSSFLDIFCYQYTLIDDKNAQAWRRVWEKWNEGFPPSECIESPCLLDYFVYRVIGKDFCRESLCIFECETKAHTFKWHSGRNKTCQICAKDSKREKAYVIKKVMPCTDDEGQIFFKNSPFVRGENAILKELKACPFEDICGSKTNSFRKLNPPKSISILGQTGWESAKTNAVEGGGGLMS